MNKEINDAIRGVGKGKSLESFVKNPVVKGLTGEQKKDFLRLVDAGVDFDDAIGQALERPDSIMNAGAGRGDETAIPHIGRNRMNDIIRIKSGRGYMVPGKE